MVNGTSFEAKIHWLARNFEQHVDRAALIQAAAGLFEEIALFDAYVERPGSMASAGAEEETP